MPANRALHTLVAATALAFPISVANSQETVPQLHDEADFIDSFTPFAALPPEPAITAQAVDLTTIDVPLEPEVADDAIPNGTASYYGRRFHGRLTASGERFDMHAMTAAHRTLPFGTRVQVTNPSNGRSVIVRINDRGPFVGDRVIDLSRAAAKKIGLIHPGKAHVELALVN